MRYAVAVASSLLGVVLYAQCVVKEIAPVPPARPVAVDAKPVVSVNAAIAAAVESKDYRAIGDAILLALKSRDFKTVSEISKAVLNKFDVLNGYGAPMSSIDALCSYGRYLESKGKDTSKVVSQIEKIVNKLNSGR